jgi:hypothetical protein
MAMTLEYESSLVLAAVLLILAIGLAAALIVATRGDDPHVRAGRRPGPQARRSR